LDTSGLSGGRNRKTALSFIEVPKKQLQFSDKTNSVTDTVLTRSFSITKTKILDEQEA
jgi:hypothetical protein